MRFEVTALFRCFLASASIHAVSSLAAHGPSAKNNNIKTGGICGERSETNGIFDGRRAFLTAPVALALATSLPASARYVLDESGEYVQLEEVDWKTAWKARIDKASTMSKDEIFQAGRGAGNMDLKEGPESDSSKKRRAFSGCRDPESLKKTGLTEKECNTRVLNGETEFMLEAMAKE